MLPLSGTFRKRRVPYIISGKRTIIQTLFREYLEIDRISIFVPTGILRIIQKLGLSLLTGIWYNLRMI